MRPAGRLCTELHRHLTTAQDIDTGHGPEAGEDEEEEEDEDSELEEDEDEEGEEEESSGSEVEGAAGVPTEPAAPQFSSEKELQSVVELITYMHTYCLPVRKQQGWERRERDAPRPRAKPEGSRSASTNSHSRVVVVPATGTIGGLSGIGTGAPRRLPFTRRREMKADSLLRELLQQNSSFDVSKPYRLHTPPYAHPHSPNRGAPSGNSSPPARSPSFKPELCKDSSSPDRRNCSSEPAPGSEDPAEAGGSFSVRRSRRLASFPSRFAKRLRPGRARDGDERIKVEREDRKAEDKLLPTQARGGTTTETQLEKQASSNNSAATETTKPCCHGQILCSSLTSLIMDLSSFIIQTLHISGLGQVPSAI